MTHKMTGKQWLALAGIAVAAFVFNSSEFMPVGLLTDIGKTFGTNEATTGMLVSVYGVGGNASFRAIDDYRNAPGLS